MKAIACVHPKYLLGARCGKASQFAVLDIDQGSPYHTPAGYSTISALLRDAGIENFGLYRSSYSGGWHVYMFFDAPISSRDLYKQLYKLFSLNGLEVAKGKLELFPNPGDESTGQGLRLPLQPGFAWLADHSQEVIEERDEISPTEAVWQFVRDIECNTNTYHDFHKLRAFVERLEGNQVKSPAGRSPGKMVQLHSVPASGPGAEAEKLVRTIFQKLPPGLNCDSWVRGKNYYQHGLSAPGQRADAVFTIGHYLFYGDPENQLKSLGYDQDEKRRDIIEKILTLKNNGHSKDIASGRAEARKHIERATSWVPPHRRGNGGNAYVTVVPISWVRNNENRAAKAQRKIIAAVEDFREAGMQFSTRDLALKSGVSTRTIAKYPDLWKSAQEELRAARLASALHEYNAVEEVSALDGLAHVFSEVGLAEFDVSKVISFSSSSFPVYFNDSSQMSGSSRRALEPAHGIWLDRVKGLLGRPAPRASERALRDLIESLSRELLLAPTQGDYLWLSEHLVKIKANALKGGVSIQLSLVSLASAS